LTAVVREIVSALFYFPSGNLRHSSSIRHDRS
jgi:hypothetical protein